MLRDDLDAARTKWIEGARSESERGERGNFWFRAYEDGAGRVADFHALRHSFITNLARAGVHPKLAQSLARPSTITLTMDRDSHTVLGEQADALERLPDLSGDDTKPERMRATGTDGALHGAWSGVADRDDPA